MGGQVGVFLPQEMKDPALQSLIVLVRKHFRMVTLLSSIVLHVKGWYPPSCKHEIDTEKMNEWVRQPYYLLYVFESA